MNKTANASESVKDKKPNIAFIGLGNMGAPMAQRAAQLYSAHTGEHGDKDFSSIMAIHDPSVLP